MLLKLSGFYFFYFALLGVMAPYLGLYLEDQGFSLLEIAQLSAILMITKVIAPNIWGSLADRYQRRLLLVRLGALLTLISYLGFFGAETFWQYAIIIVLFSFFWNAVLPQFEVITLHNLGAARSRYSRIRLWGSVGFIAAVVLLGILFEEYGIDWFPVALVCVISGILLCSLMKLNEPRIHHHEAGSNVFGQQLNRPAVWAFFVICFLLQLSHGAYYTYYSIYLEQLGYTKTEIGLLWALGVAAEVVLFIYMHLWFHRTRLEMIMFFSLLMTSVRWLMIGFGAESEIVLIIAQLLHALSFGAMHAVAIFFVHRSFSSTSQGRAQALYSSAGFGLGGAVGAMLSGVLVASIDYAHTFLVSALMSGLAACVVYQLRASFVGVLGDTTKG